MKIVSYLEKWVGCSEYCAVTNIVKSHRTYLKKPLRAAGDIGHALLPCALEGLFMAYGERQV